MMRVLCLIRVDSRSFAVSKSRCRVPACAGMTDQGSGVYREADASRSPCLGSTGCRGLGGLTSCRSRLIARTNRKEQKRNQGTDVAPLAFFLSLIFCPTIALIAAVLVLRRAHLGFRRLRHTHCVRATQWRWGSGSAEAVFHRGEPGGGRRGKWLGLWPRSALRPFASIRGFKIALLGSRVRGNDGLGWCTGWFS